MSTATGLVPGLVPSTSFSFVVLVVLVVLVVALAVVLF